MSDDGTTRDQGLRGTLASTASTYDIMFIQESLRAERLYDGPIDGVAGAKTRLAVRKYKRRHGIPVDDALDATFLGRVRDAI